MNENEMKELRESRALGALAGMTTVGVTVGAFFMREILEITQKIPLWELNFIGGALAVGMVMAAMGGGGLFGRWIGQWVIYPIRTGDDRTATRTMMFLVIVGLVLVTLIYGVISGIQILIQ